MNNFPHKIVVPLHISVSLDDLNNFQDNYSVFFDIRYVLNEINERIEDKELNAKFFKDNPKANTFFKWIEDSGNVIKSLSEKDIQLDFITSEYKKVLIRYSVTLDWEYNGDWDN